MWHKAVFFTFLWIGFFVVGCATSPGEVTIENLKVPLVDLQKVILSELPLGKRDQSLNGREFNSNYFVVNKEGQYASAAAAQMRQHIHVEILGDRRPYKIRITAPVERHTNAGYQVVKLDERLARVISRRIQKALYERREDRNIIDDFRVF